MQTNFNEKQLQNKDNQSTEKIFKKCVHCGMCNATCPTHQLLGDELDGPRGRIYLIQDMLENDKKPTAKVVKHIDRCLSCYSCMTTCPAGSFAHLGSYKIFLIKDIDAIITIFRNTLKSSFNPAPGSPNSSRCR